MAGGVVLVAGAVALGAWAVDAAADTTRVYVLSQDVAPGTDLTADGILTVVEAHPGTDAYVEAGHLPDGAVSTRSMRKGELLAAAAVNSGHEQALRPVVLNAAGQTGQGGQGGQGDQSGQAEGTGARRVATGLVIASVGETSKGLISGPGTGVEVKVPEASLAAVLSAVGQEGALVLVPTGQEAPAEKAS